MPPAQLVEFGALCPISREQLDIFDGQIELIALGVFDLDAVVGRALHLNGLEADEASDAVIDVDDEIARRQRTRFGERVGCLLRRV